jgi:zinc transporter ZupT
MIRICYMFLFFFFKKKNFSGGGAMLAVICGTMIPEAFNHGGARTALSTVAGFLVAASISALFD